MRRPAISQFEQSPQEDTTNDPMRRARPEPGRQPARAVQLLALQRTAGNRAVAARLTGSRTPSPMVVQRHTGRSLSTTEGAGGEGLGTTSGGTATDVARPAGLLSSIQGGLAAAGSAIRGNSVVKKAETYARLALTSQGRHALWILLRYRVEVDVAGTQPGSYFTSSENKIYLNQNETSPSAAIILVHEAGHAETFHRVGNPDVMSLPRVQYVKGLIEDEAQAVVRQILVIGEFESIHFDATNTSVGDAQAKRYWKAYNDAVTALGASATSSEKEAAGKKAGYDEVFNMFYDGTFVTSTTGQPYADYYGSFWDTSHAPAPA